jgi:branched-chain amino acid transport system permease protein
MIGLQLFTGLVQGMLLVLLALGLSLIFGLMTVVNFAHGAFYMLGAYVGFFILGLTGSFWLGLVVVPLAIGTLGLLVERTLIKPLYGGDLNDPLLLTFGLTSVLIEIVKLIWGRWGFPFNPPPALEGLVDLGFTLFPTYYLFVIAVSAAVVLALWLFLEKTDLGLIIRAGTRDSLMVRVLGLDFSRIQYLVFAIGTALTGLAGILAAPMRGVNPDMGQSILINAFVVIVVGGMGSLVGAVTSGLLIGQVVSLTSLYYPEMSDIVIFLFMALILLVRPAGLFGERGLLE